MSHVRYIGVFCANSAGFGCALNAPQRRKGAQRLSYNAIVKRWAWNILCALSLLIFAVSVTMWIRGCFFQEGIGHFTITDATTLSADRRYWTKGIGWEHGDVLIDVRQGIIDDPKPSSTGWSFSHYPLRAPYLEPDFWEGPWNFKRGRFLFLNRAFDEPNLKLWVHRLAVPLWIFLPFALPPLLWLRKWRKCRGRGFPVNTLASTSNATSEPVTIAR